MELLAAEFDARWEPLVGFALGVCGAVGVLAMLDPRRILALAFGEHGEVDLGRSATGIQRSAAAGFYALALCRACGLALLGGVVALAWYLGQPQ